MNSQWDTLSMTVPRKWPYCRPARVCDVDSHSLVKCFMFMRVRALWLGGFCTCCTHFGFHLTYKTVRNLSTLSPIHELWLMHQQCLVWRGTLYIVLYEKVSIKAKGRCMTETTYGYSLSLNNYIHVRVYVNSTTDDFIVFVMTLIFSRK